MGIGARGAGLARGAAALCVAALCAGSLEAAGQVFVYPRHAEKSQVRYFDFEWHHVDLLVGPEADTSVADNVTQGHVPGTPTGEPLQQGQGPATDPGSTTGVAGPADFATDGGTPVGVRPGDGGAAVVATPGDGGAALALAPGDGGAALAVALGDGGAALAVAPGDGGAALASAPDAGVNPWFVYPQLADGGTADLATLGPRTGGVRMFFYERERAIAERAAHIILGSYRKLVDDFRFVPTQTFPYILYSSYQEFLQTNLFPLSEGVLGVTSTVGDLSLTLPYFGDHQFFTQVSVHEMAHQFTIQKVRHLAEQAKLNGDPLEGIPLWFIEGLAQFYALGGIDDEADLLIRDLVTNPDPELGYALINFWEDRPYSVLWTYQAGQIRVTFLEETYGAGFIQKVLDQSPSLVGTGTFRRASVDFQGLIERITGDNPQTIGKKFEQWIKRRSYGTYLEAQQDVSNVELFPEGFSVAGAMNASPNGDVVLYRSFEESTGRSSLILVDPRAPSKSRLVTIDGIPGAESLHPVFGRNFDVGNDFIAYVAEVHGRDVLYLQKFKHRAHKREMNPAFGKPEAETGPQSLAHPPPQRVGLSGRPKELWEVDLDLGDRSAYALGDKGLLGAFYPAISPDGKRIAFVGLSEKGIRDLYVLEPTDGQGGYNLKQLTNDEFSERQVGWGPKGVVFASDATAHGHYNLFLISGNGGPITRLTHEARDHQDVEVLPDGRVMFVAYGEGRADVHEVVGTNIVRRTDIATGLFDLSPGPNGGLWALFHYRGRRHPVQLKKEELLTLEALPITQNPGEPQRAYTIARTSLDGSKPYNTLDPDNWQLDPPFGYIGAGGSQIVGQVFAQATDRLRNHGLILNAAVLGRFDLTNGVLLYVNQERRISWAAGLFQTVNFRFDNTFPNELTGFVSGERFYGGVGSARYPFNPFVYVEGELSLGGMEYFLEQFDRFVLATPEINGTGRDLLGEWRSLNGRTRFHSELTLRLGYDTLRYHPATGPIAGNSVLLEVSGATQPFDQQFFGSTRVDAEQYFPIEGRAHVMVRGGFGAAFGGRLARQFFLSSFDTIRGHDFGNRDALLGSHFFFSTAELQVPLNSFIRLILLSDLEAIAGVDFGGVANNVSGIWDRRLLDAVLGVNFGLGPLIFRLHFARPIDTGNTLAGVRYNEWVTNFSLGVVGLPGFSMKKSPSGSMGYRQLRSPVLR